MNIREKHFLKKHQYKKKKDIEQRKWYRYHFFGSAKVTILKEDKVVDTDIANLSLSGIGLYSTESIGKGKRIKILISFIDRNGKIQEEIADGIVSWERKFKTKYLIGVVLTEELSVYKHPRLIEHLLWLIDINHLPKPFIEKRIDIL